MTALTKDVVHIITAVKTKLCNITSHAYTFIQQNMYRESGIGLEPVKHSLLDVRLLPIVKSAQLQTINDLCALLKATAPTPYKRAVIEAMTTHETLFFRDNSAFEALRTSILPQLKALRSPTRRLNIWSAAASSGQEAYSI